MYEKMSILGLSNKEWLSMRKQGIGGSDAGAICGVNPYSSPLKVYRDKTSEYVEEVNTEATRIGHDLEQYVAERFMEATGFKVRKSNYMYKSKKYPYMIADVDRMVVGEDAGLECKTASAYNADKWKDGNIPIHYVLQCYHYMAVTGKKTWYIACVIMGSGFVYHKIVWDDEIIQRLIESESNFWNNHVIKKVMPDPDGSIVSDEIIEQYFHVAREKSCVELTGFDEQLERREQILSTIEELQKEQKVIEQKIKVFMQDNESAKSAGYKITWKNIETCRLDTKRIKDEKPEIFENFSKVINSRRFSVKKIA